MGRRVSNLQCTYRSVAFLKNDRDPTTLGKVTKWNGVLANPLLRGVEAYTLNIVEKQTPSIKRYRIEATAIFSQTRDEIIQDLRGGM